MPSNGKPKNEDLVTAVDAAGLLGCSLDHIWRLIESRDLTPCDADRHLRFKRAEVLALIPNLARTRAPLITAKEAAKILNCPVRGVWFLVVKRELYEIKTNGRTWFEHEVVIALKQRIDKIADRYPAGSGLRPDD